SQKIEKKQLEDILNVEELTIFNKILTQKLTFRNDEDIDFFINKISEYVKNLYWYTKKQSNKEIDIDKYFLNIGSRIKTRKDMK
ncbi:MAG TPA: hypothetical protein GX695_04680, partial [Acholeplasmataceae bacterium]|nr:hypothetical protein [Acholeplasmataceae bacterium]